jgi:hypothetical protein
VEEAAEEGSRVSFDDLDLPRFQHDGSFVLASSAVLWEQARPVHPVAEYRDASGLLVDVTAPASLHGKECLPPLVYERAVARVLHQRQQVDAALVPDDVSIAEVDPQEKGIARTIEGPVTAAGARAPVGPTNNSATLVEPSPAPDGLDGHAAHLGDFAIEDPEVREKQSLVDGCL